MELLLQETIIENGLAATAASERKTNNSQQQSVISTDDKKFTNGSMDSFKAKYTQACQQLKQQPNESIVHAIRESNKKNQTRERNFVLNLSGCSISVNDSNALSKCFATDSFLEEYHFTDCLLCEDSLKVILNSLSFNKTIKILDLKGNNLRASGSELIGKMLKRTSLVELYLEWNSLGMCDSGIVAVAEGIALNQTLRVLDLSNNQITHEGGEQIANALKRNKQLRVLDMRWNNVGVIGGRAFLSALSHNKYLVTLELAGNNIPSDTMKAISTAVKRNVDYHSIYEQHHTKTQSMRQEIDQLQLEKSMQVSTLIDQLEREKELHTNLSETTRDRLDQMRMTIEDLKGENRYLRGKTEEYEEQIKSLKQEMKDLVKSHEVAKSEFKAKEQEMVLQKNEMMQVNTREKRECQTELLKRVDEIQSLNDDKKDLGNRLDIQAKELMHLKELLKRNEQNFDSERRSLIEKYNQEKDDSKAHYDHQMKVQNSKLAKLNDEKERLEEEISRLKSNIMNDKLAFEEDMLNLRGKWKQEDALKTKQYDDRIDLLVKGKDELQSKLSKMTVEQAETHTQLVACQKERDAYKRQCDQTQQLLNQRDLEYRNESNRMKLEVDSEKRVTAELRDKVANFEMKTQDLRSQLKDLAVEKDNEKSKLQDIIKAKGDEIRRIRDDEIRRASILESALQTYISSARSQYKS